MVQQRWRNVRTIRDPGQSVILLMVRVPAKEAFMISLEVNGKKYEIEVTPTFLCSGSSGASRTDRNEIWLREVALRRLHRPYRR